MNFLVDINPNKELPKYSMILCKLNEEQIMTITNITNLEYKGEFVNIDELSFEIPLYRMESDGTQIKNERYDAIKGDMLILLNETKFFYIHYAKEKVNNDGSTYKEVQAYSREFELSNKIISGYSGISRKIYDYTNQKDENNLEIGYFNYIEHICSWRVSYVNPNVLAKFRALDFPNTNVLQSFQEVQQTFGCLLQFNTLDKTIDIYEADQLGINQGLRISDRNFLQSLEKTIKSNEIKTRLHLFGRDNISIQKLSITGQDHIDNYDFYKTTEYMSQDLIEALDNYDAYLLTKQGLFDGYLTQLNNKNAELGVRNDELVELQTQLKVIQSNLDVAISSGQPTGTFKTQETNKLAEISTKLSQILTLQGEIDTINNNINSIAVETDMTAHFTEAQARELDSFIREDTFTDSNYTEDNLDELLAEGKKILSRISQPAIQFNVSVVDFLSVVECQHEWSKFVLGDKVNLYHRDLNFDYEVRLVGYTHNPDSNSLDLKFSNTNTIDDANLYLRDLLADLKTTSTNVDFSRFKWDKGEQANSMISNYINSNLDLAKQQILKADGQKPMMDERGIWLIKENPDGTIDPKQMRLINNTLAISADNWNGTPEVAISAENGINANLIRGKLGEFAEIHANQIIVGSGGELIPNELIDGFSDVDDFMSTVYPTDLQGIRDQIDGKVSTWFYEYEPTLTNEPALDWDTNTIKDNHLGDTFYNTVTGYSYRFAKVSGIYQWLRITDSDVTRALEIASQARDTADRKRTVFLVQPTTPYDAGDLWRDKNKIDLQVCINGKKTGSFALGDWANSTNINEYLNTQFSELSNSVDGLGITISESFSDNKLTNIEANNLKLSMDNMIKESEDIINVASSLGIIDEKESYSTSLDNLKTEINKWINKIDYPLNITNIQRTNINGLFSLVENSKSILVNKIISVRERNTVDYIDGQVEEFETSIENLTSSINEFSDNLKLTRSEANSLKNSLEGLKSESLDLINIADSLFIVDEKNTYSASLDSLESFLNTNWLGRSYPLSITDTQRTTVLDLLKDVENKKSILVNTIMIIRENNTKSYTNNKIVDFNTNVLVPSISQLNTQIDGKIDTWFYAVAPTLSNEPASNWITNSNKDKHLDDMYYNTSTGYSYRFIKNGVVYSWARIKDDDIETALTKASMAQSTADKKMTVFITQPTTPYHIGDLWRPSASATDLKICTTEKLTGLYDASHWSNATNVAGAISGLQSSVNDFSSDLKLTLAEANSLKTLLEGLTAESTSLISNATTVGVTTEKTNYSTSLTTLTNYLNTYWLGKTYPLTITITQKTNVSNNIKDVESKKSILINAIMGKRESNTRVDFQATTDSIIGRVASVEGTTGGFDTRLASAESKITPSAITTTVQNNTTTLATKALVTQTSDSWTANFTNLKNLATGQQLAGGVTTISRNGIKVAHTGTAGQYSEMRADGFVRKWQYGETKYLNDIYVRKFYEEGDDLGTSQPDPYRIYLPMSFKGRNNVEIYVVPLAYEYDIGRFNNDGTIRWLTIDLEVICRVAVFNRFTGEESKDLNGDPPWVNIDVYLKNYWKHETYGTTKDYYGIDWLLIAIGS